LFFVDLLSLFLVSPWFLFLSASLLVSSILCFVLLWSLCQYCGFVSCTTC
jgi:hypothetical protein